MRCEQVRWYITLQHPRRDELGPELRQALEEHYAACPRCAAYAASVAGFDRAVVAALRDVPVPPALRERLHLQAAAWYGQRLRQRIYRWCAAAAAGLGVVGGYYLYSLNRLPPNNLEPYIQQTETLQLSPVQALEQWLAEQGLPRQLPLPLDTDLLIHVGQESVNGRMLPVAVFQHPERRGTLKLYLVRRSRWRTPAQPELVSSHLVAQYLERPELAPGWSFVVVYPAGPEGLKPFLRQPPTS